MSDREDTVMERYRAWTLRYVGSPEPSGGCNAVVNGPTLTWHGNDVEVVPASQLAGAVVLDDDTLAALDKRAAFQGSDRAGYLRWVLTGATDHLGGSRG